MGILVVETIAKIRRAYFVQGKSIKAISRELRVSRKVVRKVLRTGATFLLPRTNLRPRLHRPLILKLRSICHLSSTSFRRGFAVDR
jgi:hypothetical protein